MVFPFGSIAADTISAFSAFRPFPPHSWKRLNFGRRASFARKSTDGESWGRSSGKIYLANRRQIGISPFTRDDKFLKIGISPRLREFFRAPVLRISSVVDLLREVIEDAWEDGEEQSNGLGVFTFAFTLFYVGFCNCYFSNNSASRLASANSASLSIDAV